MIALKKQVCFFLFSLLEICFWVSAQNPSSGCPLNFQDYTYKPVGECLSDSQKLNEWGSITTTRCCRNALGTLTQSLAAHALVDDALFIPWPQWQTCKFPVPDSDALPFHRCNFDNLYRGSSLCTDLDLNLFRTRYNLQYKTLIDRCSQFDEPSFTQRCVGCAETIKKSRDFILGDLQAVNNDTEARLCVVSLVVAVVAEKIRVGSPVEDFYRCLPALDTQTNGGGYIRVKSSMGKAILAILIASMGLMLMIVLIKYVTKTQPAKHVDGKEISTWSGLYRFSRTEIENAIGSEKVELGCGSAGQVYRGVLPSGQLVAIKHLYKNNMSDSFTREVDGLSKIRHPNLVCLFGCCVDGAEKYLVYEYCSYGNLAEHLLRKDSVLSWDTRVKILRYCALALRFLHTYPDGCIVHRDIKLTNILLTENMEPKLSDFGLAKMIGMEESKVFTDVRGTIGYMDPEYMTNAKLTCASDVYSFGIVALQILSGRRVIELDVDVEARDSLTRTAKDVKNRRRPLSDFEDPRLNGNLDEEEFVSILQIAVLCVANSSKGRPMIDVIYKEMDKAWKNTVEKMNNRKMYSSNSMTTPPSRSFDMMHV